MLKLENITKNYGAGDSVVEALKGINLEFRANEFVSILGHSGCGKTTMLNIIGGLDRYTSGDLIINGKSTKEFSDRDWDSYRNHSIGFVFQSYNLISHITVLANVELALTLSGVSKAERRKRATEILERVGLSDQINKMPNQLSGGQMQRVAIARALVNDPEILLADEPTGALDTETSLQIMELLKEIANDRLVIMVTHNPELAETYSTRIVKLIDGKIVDDSNPVESEKPAEEKTEEPNKKRKKTKKSKTEKTSMSFFTALSLSFNNLMTKKGRTFLTSFAGSIGIIGIALILSVSSGVNAFINRVQEDTLSAYPVTLSAEEYDMNEMITTMMKVNEESSGTVKTENTVYSSNVLYELMNDMNNMQVNKNNLEKFKTYVESGESDIKKYSSAIQYSYGLTPSIYSIDTEDKIFKSDVSELFEMMYSAMGVDTSAGPYASMMNNMQGFTVWEELLAGEDGEMINDIIKQQYDVYGEWPDEMNEIVLVVDGNNEISDITLYALGLRSADKMMADMEKYMKGEELDTTIESWSYDELIGREFKVITAPDMYSKNANGVYEDLSKTDLGLKSLYNSETAATTLKISGILKKNEDAVSGMISGSLCYTKALADYLIEKTNNSELVKAQLQDENTDILTNLPFETEENVLSDEKKIEMIKEYFAGLDNEKKVEIYVDIKATPSEEYLSQTTSQYMQSLDRAAIEEKIMEMYESENGSSADSVKEYLATLSDDELISMIEEYIKQQLTEQYAATVKAQLANLPQTQLAMMFSAEKFEDGDYLRFFDKYMPPVFSEMTRTEVLETLGYIDETKPASIKIYAKTFEDKDLISESIAYYNDNVVSDEDDKISYTDYVKLLMSSITTIINAISYVLIAFVSISLVVSSIMIGIITYISVLERTKEIGILRSIGASKGDISRVFNAETLVVGFVSGALGIGITLILNIFINIILHALTGLGTLNAVLPTVGAVALVVISMFLTFIAGLVPSKMAAKKDPVIALRSGD